MFKNTLARVLTHTEDRIGLCVLALALTLFAALPASAHEYKIGSLEVAHPWVRMTPAGAKVGGGYLVIENDGSAPDRLVSATAPDVSDRVEIHEMAVKDGIMTMRMLPDGVDVPPHGKVALAPGGYHLMMMDLKKPLVQGERIKGTLTFAKAGTVNVEFAVEGMGGPKGSAAGTDGAPPMDHSMHGAPAN